MSFDIFLQRFRDGEPEGFERKVFEEVFGCSGPDIASVSFADGSASDVYLEEGDEIEEIMFNHFGGDAFFAALFELARRTGAVIFWPDDGPSVVVTDEATLPHLPPDMADLGPPRVVGSGAELAAAIEGAG